MAPDQDCTDSAVFSQDLFCFHELLSGCEPGAKTWLGAGPKPIVGMLVKLLIDVLSWNSAGIAHHTFKGHSGPGAGLQEDLCYVLWNPEV